MDVLKLLSFMGGAPLGAVANGKPEMLGALGGLGGLAAAKGKPEMLGPLAGAMGAGASGVFKPKADGATMAGYGGGTFDSNGNKMPEPGGSPSFNAAFADIAPPQPAAPRPSPLSPETMNVGPLGGGMGDYERGTMDAQIAAQMPDKLKRGGGVFDRIGDFVGSDRGKGALLRAGATMLSTGDIGRGVMAGADFVDERQNMDAAAARDQRNFDLDERRVDAGILDAAAGRELQQQGLVLDQFKLAEAIRKARAGEELDAQELASLNAWRNIQAMVQTRGQDISRENNIRTTSVSRENNIRSTDASRYSTDQANYRHNTPSASSTGGGAGSIVQTTKGTPAVEPGFWSWLTGEKGTPATPDQKTTMNVMRLPPNATPEQLTAGVVYATVNGPALWNGREFESVQ